MVNFNGNLIESSTECISVENRGLNYGDAVFETIRVIAGNIVFWEHHYFRLMASMRILRMEIPMNFTLEFLEEEIIKTLKGSKSEDKPARVKILVFRKEGGKYLPQTSDVAYLISSEILENPFYAIDEKPYEIELFKDYYISSGLLSTLKTNNRIINVLGSIFANENEYQNCFLLNEQKNVVEALNGNIFLITGNVLKTPPLLDGCINGILRKQLISIIKKLPEFVLIEDSISPFELQKADELFITNVIVGIQRVSKYRKKEFESKIAKELTAKLNLKIKMD